MGHLGCLELRLVEGVLGSVKGQRRGLAAVGLVACAGAGPQQLVALLGVDAVGLTVQTGQDGVPGADRCSVECCPDQALGQGAASG